MHLQEKSRQKQLASYTHNRAQGFTRSQDDRPLLGYDWIAADLDNTGSVLDYNDSFFDDIREFRSRNRDDCQDKFNSEYVHCLVQDQRLISHVL